VKRPRIIYRTADGSTAVYGTVRIGGDPLAELAKAREFLSRGWRGRPDADELAASVRLAFGCRSCGSDRLVAWYPTYERQGVEILGYDGDSLEIDYDGVTDTADDAGENEEYRCLNCDDHADTLEELCGLPRAKAAEPVYTCEVFDSLGTVAISFAANGQDVAHLRWTDSTTAADEFAEHDWRELTDDERQAILDAVASAVEKITRGQQS
jgi:hypothetical protein